MTPSRRGARPATGARASRAARAPDAADASLPPTSLVRRVDVHRLIPSRHRPREESVLALLADDDRHLADIFELDHATNDRLRAEHDLLPGIGVHELVFGVPNFRVINAAFAHAHPLGSRFNGPDRGAWYAAFDVATSQAEVAFHRSADLAEIGRFDDTVTYDDYLADVGAELHDVRADARFADCLDPNSYVASQALAERLLDAGALGVVYPSVRDPAGTCVALFRPALVTNVRRAETWRFTWSGTPEPTISRV